MKTKINISILLVLQTLDIILTHYCLQTGLIGELNPLMAYLFNNYNMLSVLAFKLIATISIMGIGFKYFLKRMNFYLIIANVIMTMVVLLNTYSLCSVN